MTPRRFDDRQFLVWMAALAFTGALLYLLGPILSPFLFAAILAYICNPLVERLAKRRVPRGAAAALVLVLLGMISALLLVILLPMVVRQVRAVAEQMPVYLDWARTHLEPWTRRTFGIELDMQTAKEWLVEHVAEIQKYAVKLLPSLGVGGLALIEFALNLVLVPVVLFYLLRDWDKLVRHIDVMIPRRWHAETRTILRDIDCVLGEFLRGQLLVMLLMGVFYVAALWLVGLRYALAIGLIAGLLTFIPFVGVITGIVLATLAALLQFDSYTPIFWIWGIFFAANMLEGYVFVPMLVGDRIGLHPVAVIFALLAFGQLFGFFGVLLALPASAALLVWLRHLRGKYPRKRRLQRAGRPVKQLAFDFVVPAVPTLDNFVTGRNAEAVQSLCDLTPRRSVERCVYIWGAGASGRTHLLRATLAKLARAGNHIAFLADENALLEAQDQPLDAAAIDDVDRLGEAGQGALFSLYNRLRESGGVVVAAGPVPPAQLSLRADVVTRLAWGLTFEVHALSDTEKAHALAEHAAHRGFGLPPDVFQYLLTHAARDMRTLVALVESLDRYSLETKRAVTVPLLRELLALRT